mmetsp:Transcript_17973/g.21841  ORF Transcript_17973/g.21841 Transcript_17973/m.21841 type:complete len:188 (+) Transcript_17973:462-1025(+)
MTGGKANFKIVLVSIMNVGNSYGRMLAGFASERYKSSIHRPTWFVLALAAMCFAQATLAVSQTIQSLSMLLLGTTIMGLSYGAFWALSPTICAELFGTAHYGANYALLNLAPASGGYFVSVCIAGYLYDYFGTKDSEGKINCSGSRCFEYTFCIAAGLSFVGMLSSLLLRRNAIQWYATTAGIAQTE